MEPQLVVSITPDGRIASKKKQHRFSNQVLSVKNLCFDVDETGSGWWQRIAQCQMPWEYWGGNNRAKRRLLHNINLEVKSGEMLAVLGGSGSGKTTLLDCISGQTSSGEISGDVFLNNEPRTPELIRKCTAYVHQTDRLLPHLTVKETLMFVAHLKLPSHWKRHQREARVASVIRELGLKHVTDSKVGGPDVRGISGGERRRVSIGVQLLLDPGILFLDEPTSGLDSFTAHHLVETLKRLSRNDRIVMLSIHQPRSDIFALFDLVMLLSRGHVIYHGWASQMIHYFTNLGFPCPDFTNPCDYYVDLITVDFKDPETEALTNERMLELVRLFKQHLKQLKDEGQGEGAARGKRTHSPSRSVSPRQQHAGDKAVQSPRLNLESFWQVEVTEDGRVNWREESFQTVGPFWQFIILINRVFTNHTADFTFLAIQAVEALCMSLMIGAIFFGLEKDQVAIRDRFGVLYVLAALYPYMVILDVTGQYHEERAILYYEMQDGLYSHTPYYFAKLLSEIPEHTVFTCIYSAPVYYMAGLQNDGFLFFTTSLLLYLVVYCSRSLALFAGALLPTYQLSVLFAQSMYMIMMLSCGFVYNLDSLFVGMSWVSYVSYLKWGFQGMCINEFTGLNFTCVPPNSTQCIRTGEAALEAYSLDGGEVWWSGTVIAVEILGWLILFYVSFVFISQKPHEQS